MKLPKILVAVFAGGALALAAPAVAGAEPGGNTLTAEFQPGTVQAGAAGTVSLTFTLGQPGDEVADGTVVVTHSAALTFVSAGDTSAQCTDTGRVLTCAYTDLAHSYKSDAYVFGVSQRIRQDVAARVVVTLQDTAPVKASARLTVDCPSASPSESPSSSPSVPASPSTSPSTQSPSASPSASTSPSGSVTPSPSLTLAGNGGGAGTSGGGLPVTGMSLTLFGGAAALLLAAGGGLLILARRRRGQV